MAYQTLKIEISRAIATVTLNRPEKRNAITQGMIAELQSALDEIEKGPAASFDLHWRGQGILFRDGPR